MTRIAGIVSPVERPLREIYVKHMLSEFNSRKGWACQTLTLGSATFGWSGWQNMKLRVVDNLMFALDGTFFDQGKSYGIDSDLQAFSESYRAKGLEETLLQLNGDFAIAVYEMERGSLHLARDRFGIKPLYYALPEKTLAFASQPGSLLKAPGVSREVNSKFVGVYAGCHYRYFDNDISSSPFSDIKQLPGSHFISFTRKGTNSKKYWSLEEAPDFSTSEEQLAAEYRELLIDSVSIRLEKSTRPIFTLSGGMDSSSILGTAVSILQSPQNAVSATYSDETYDESEDIKSILDTHVSRWHAVGVDAPDLFSVLQEMIAVHHEPVATATWLSHYLLSKFVFKSGFQSVFGGLGGDELNAGEYEYFTYHFADLEANGKYDQLENEVNKWIEYHDHPIFRKTARSASTAVSLLVDSDSPGRFDADRGRISRYDSVIDPEYFDSVSFQPIMEYPFQSYLKNRTYQDQFRETAPPCLRALDRQNSSFNLDNFQPFFDHRLSEFMYRIPGDMKIRNGVTKVLLRRAMEGILPDVTRNRIKKTGWNAPAHLWFSGKGKDFLNDIVESRAFRERGIYDIKKVKKLIDEHTVIVEGGLHKENHMMFLWQLINLELWFQWIDER